MTLDSAGGFTNPAQRNFDLNANTFTLNYAKVGIGVNADPVGLRLDLGYGATGLLINGANPSDASSDPFLVQQAYATFAPVKGLTIDFGKFVTTAGAEVIEANKNWLYSRSIAFFNIPLLHTGFRAGYKVNDMMSLQISVVNGWNGVGIAPDVTGAKTYGASLNLTSLAGLNVIATTYIGKNEAIFPGRLQPGHAHLGRPRGCVHDGRARPQPELRLRQRRRRRLLRHHGGGADGPLRGQRRVRVGGSWRILDEQRPRRPSERARGHHWWRVPDGQPPRGSPRGPRRLP